MPANLFARASPASRNHVVVLGAGVIGVTTAWYLRQAGFEVTVVERQPQAALETSFANGSQISISYAEPWANPRAPLQILASLGRRDAALRFRAMWDSHQWAWGLAFLRECSAKRSRHNTEHLVRLGSYSRGALHELRQCLPLHYDALQRGVMHLFETDRECEHARPAMALMRSLGCPIEFISMAGALALEPALQTIAPGLKGVAFASDDESGDAFKFTQQLASLAEQAGVRFLYNTHVRGLLYQGDAITGATVDGPAGLELIHTKATVVSMGSWSAPFLRPYGVSLRVYPAKGYSATMRILKPDAVSQVSLTDHRRKLVFSRLGNDLRVAGTAEFKGYDLTLEARRCESLVARAAQMFPGALDLASARFWTGLRPATPSNVPYIGASIRPGLWLNTGHGTLGWTHAAGSAKALACLMRESAPALDFPFVGQAMGPSKS